MRCKSDAAISAIADTGGLLGVYVLPNMLGPNATLTMLTTWITLPGWRELSMPLSARDTPPKARLSRRESNGVKTPGLTRAGGATGNPTTIPCLLPTRLPPAAWPGLIGHCTPSGLVMRGYSDEDAARISGGNLMRVLEANRAGGGS